MNKFFRAQIPPYEIIKRGKFANLDLDKPYYVVVMEYQKTEKSSLSMEEEFYLQEQILETIFEYFNEHKYQNLIGQREGKLILLMTNDGKDFSIQSNDERIISIFAKIFQRRI